MVVGCALPKEPVESRPPIIHVSEIWPQSVDRDPAASDACVCHQPQKEIHLPAKVHEKYANRRTGGVQWMNRLRTLLIGPAFDAREPILSQKGWFSRRRNDFEKSMP